MRQVLLLTNTYFQLIVAIQLRRTVLRDAAADVLITNHSAGCEALCSRLKNMNLFRNVYFVRQESRNLPPGLLRRIRYFLPYAMRREKMLSQLVRLPEDYDEIWFNNAITLTHLVWRHCPRTALYRFEEGFSTYTKPLIEKPGSKRMLRLAFGEIESHIKGLYLFHPELFSREIKAEKRLIPGLDRSDKELLDTLNRVFDYHPREISQNAPFIFFEEAFRADQEPVPDLELIQRVADLVGRENLLIKRHPRSRENPYPALGLKTWEEAEPVPWEVIHMNISQQGYTLLSISSGSILSSILYFPERVPSYLLYRCLPVRPKCADEAFDRYIRNVQKKADWLHIPDDLTQLASSLSRQKNR